MSKKNLRKVLVTRRTIVDDNGTPQAFDGGQHILSADIAKKVVDGGHASYVADDDYNKSISSQTKVDATEPAPAAQPKDKK